MLILEALKSLKGVAQAVVLNEEIDSQKSRQNEQIISEGDGSSVLANDGKNTNEETLSPETSQPQPQPQAQPEAINASDIEAEVAAIQEALLSGEDPLEVGEATAAGGGTDGDSLHEPVIINYNKPQVTPESGFDTTGLSIDFDQPDPESLQDPDVDFEVSISDLTPAIEGGDIVVDEDDLPQGSDLEKEATTVEGTFTISAEDGVGKLSVDGHTVIINGVFTPSSFTTALGNTIEFTSYNQSTGEITYRYTLLANATHASGQGENELFEEFIVTLTDTDDDSVSDTLSIRIVDDVPEAMDEGTVAVQEGEVVNGTLDFIEGADGATVTHINGEVLAFDQAGWSQAVDIGHGTLRVMEDGHYEFMADAVIDNSNEVIDLASFTVTDSDGDETQATVSFDSLDANEPVADPTAATVDDEGLAEGIAGGANDVPGEVTSFSGTLNLDFGGDGAGSVGFAAMGREMGMVGQEEVTYSWSDDTLTATISDSSDSSRLNNVLFTVKVDDAMTGDYTVSLLDNVLHVDDDANDENDALASLTYTVTDGDGSQAESTLDITFDDDTPVAVDDGNLSTLSEQVTNVSVGSVSALLSNDGFGADGGSITRIGSGSLGGSISIDGNGNLIYSNSTHNVAAGDTDVESFTYTITDGDGDTVTAEFSVSLTDSSVSNVQASTNLVADDDDAGTPVAPGNPGGVGDDTPVLSGTISYDLGEDSIGSVALSTTNNETGLQTLAGEAIDTTFVNGVLIGYIENTDPADASNQIFSITLGVAGNSSTDYTLELFQPVQHATGANENNTVPFTVDVLVTDSDGSEGATSFTVTVDDDTPLATNDGNLATLSENVDSVTVGDVTDLLSNDGFGADGGSITRIGSGSLGGSISIDGNGNLIYSNTSHDVAEGDTDIETFEYTITDGDGDTVTAEFSVSLTDSSVSNVQASTNLVADDDDAGTPVAPGNPGGVGDDTPVLSGTISYDLGEDSIGSVALSTTNNETGLLTLSGDAVLTQFSNGVLTGHAAGDTNNIVFTITLGTSTDSATGYTMVLFQPVYHSVGNDENNTAPFTVNVLVTDSDGSAGATSFTVTIDDDTPVAVDDGNLATLSEQVTNVSVGSVSALLSNDGFGADGEGNPNISIGDGSLGGSISIDGSGNLIYSNSTHNVAAGDTDVESFTYTITDGDGDTVTAEFSVSLTDSGVGTVTATNELVDEDDLAAGIGNVAPGDDDPLDTGSISFTDIGADGLDSVSLSSTTALNTANGEAVNTTFVVSPDGFDGTLYGYTGATFDINDSSNWVYSVALSDLDVNSTSASYDTTLYQAVQHTDPAPDAAFEDDVVITVDVSVRDGDGSTGNTSFAVTIDDDTPVQPITANISVMSDNFSDALFGVGENGWASVEVWFDAAMGSGERTVTVDVPDGFVVDEALIRDGGVYDSGEGTVTWTLLSDETYFNSSFGIESTPALEQAGLGDDGTVDWTVTAELNGKTGTEETETNFFDNLIVDNFDDDMMFRTDSSEDVQLDPAIVGMIQETNVIRTITLTEISEAGFVQIESADSLLTFNESESNSSKLTITWEFGNLITDPAAVPVVDPEFIDLTVTGANVLDFSFGVDNTQINFIITLSDINGETVVFQKNDISIGKNTLQLSFSEMLAETPGIDLSQIASIELLLDATATNGGADISITPPTFSYSPTVPDIVTGTAGDDVLVDGLGDEVLVGDDGADRFDFDVLDDGSNDTIIDFSEAEGDVLDIAGLLADADADLTNVAISNDGTDTTVTITNPTTNPGEHHYHFTRCCMATI